MTPIDPPEALLQRLRAADRFLLSGHLNPDGDSIGSGLGLARLLAHLGKTTTIWNRDETPAVYSALPGAERMHIGSEPPFSRLDDHFDVVVTLECPSLDRTGLEDSLKALPIINLDHHLGNRNYGVVNWVDAASPALGEMILRLSRALGVPPPPPIGADQLDRVADGRLLNPPGTGAHGAPQVSEILAGVEAVREEQDVLEGGDGIRGSVEEAQGHLALTGGAHIREQGGQ